MKKILYIFMFCLSLTLIGCQGVLDTKSREAFGEDLIYSDPDQVDRLVITAYNSTDSWSINRYQWWGRRFNIEGASFEAKFNFEDQDIYRMRAGLTPANAGIFTEKWSDFWYYIRMINEFLDKVDDCEAMSKDPDKVGVFKAEMIFLRADLYAKLIKYYGGVPIMRHALGLNDNFNLARDSYQDCVDFIVQELDEAARVLPQTRPASEFGRATKLAALASKSRVLLYAASKLHDPQFAPVNNKLYTYNKATKWQDAADAAKDVIDLVDERDLIEVEDAGEYQKLFLTPNKDIFFARAYGSQYYDFGTDANTLWDMTQSPNGYGGWGLSSPTHNFVLQFNMADGTTTTETATTYDPEDPYIGREMRFYADILYNGCQFRGRDVQYYLSDDPDTYPHGKDSPEGLGNTGHSSKTGYNMRKFQDESVDVAGGISAKRPYILYRLAEIYLNYAEAQYHLDNETTAQKFLNKVSSRALQPDIDATGPDLLEAIKRERRIELCFEGHNFFDERRWMEQNKLGFDIRGLKWKKASNGTVSFEEYTVVTRPYFEKHYYLPIPSKEREKAPALEQNHLY